MTKDQLLEKANLIVGFSGQEAIFIQRALEKMGFNVGNRITDHFTEMRVAYIMKYENYEKKIQYNCAMMTAENGRTMMQKSWTSITWKDLNEMLGFPELLVPQQPRNDKLFQLYRDFLPYEIYKTPGKFASDEFDLLCSNAARNAYAAMQIFEKMNQTR